jgi:hypothetical protein
MVVLYEVVSESSRIAIVLTRTVKEDETEFLFQIITLCNSDFNISWNYN